MQSATATAAEAAGKNNRNDSIPGLSFFFFCTEKKFYKQNSLGFWNSLERCPRLGCKMLNRKNKSNLHLIGKLNIF